MPLSAGARHAAPRALQKSDQRELEAAGEFFCIHTLAKSGRGGRTAALGEILAADHAGSPIQLREAEHVVGGREADQLPVLAVLGLARDGALFPKRPRVDERVDALPNRQPPEFVLLGDGFFTSELRRQLSASFDSIDFGLPAHARMVVEKRSESAFQASSNPPDQFAAPWLGCEILF